MGISLNKSISVSSRVALGRSVERLSRCAESLATGNAQVDATGRSIGSSLQGDAQVIDVVLTGLKQSKAMFYIAEQGIKSLYDTSTQMTQVVAKAKLGFMNDNLIKTTLAPVYQQLKAELDRIAEAINFNNQALFNGSGNSVVAPVRSNMSTTPNVHLTGAKLDDNSLDTDVAITDILPALSADIAGSAVTAANFKITADTASKIQFDTFGSQATYDKITNKTTITGVRLIYQDVNYTDSDTTTPKIGKTDILIDDVKLTVDGIIEKNKTTLTGKVTIVNTATEMQSKVVSFRNSKNAADADITINAGSLTAATAGNFETIYTGTKDTATPANYTTTISNIDASTVTLSGGETGKTKLEFVTNRDLFASKVSFDFPTLTLDKLIPTLNTTAYRGDDQPRTLTNLQTEADANVDIALIDSLVNKMVVELGNVSAAQIRINNIIGQVETQTDETYKAMSEILHTDIPKAVEELAQVNANVQLTMITLQRMVKYVDQILILVQ
jgi:flagellin-like hook-associated protein FlgL